MNSNLRGGGVGRDIVAVILIRGQGGLSKSHPGDLEIVAESAASPLLANITETNWRTGPRPPEREASEKRGSRRARPMEGEADEILAFHLPRRQVVIFGRLKLGRKESGQKWHTFGGATSIRRRMLRRQLLLIIALTNPICKAPTLRDYLQPAIASRCVLRTRSVPSWQPVPSTVSLILSPH
jgi:hypothetical protein